MRPIYVNGSSVKIQRIKRKIQVQLGKYPRLFFLAYRFIGKKQKLAVSTDAQIVIEGFPRSGNTFAVVAFELSQPQPVKISHHLHVPAQIIQAAYKKIPCVVLIRNPVDAVISLVIRESIVSLDIALDEYILFYEHVFPFRENFVIATFDSVISDYGRIIDKANKKFNQKFGLFQHTPENVQKVFNIIDKFEYFEDKDRVNEGKVARPSDCRISKKNKLLNKIELPQYTAKIQRALNIFNRLTQ